MVFAGSSVHLSSLPQMFEQQSAFVVQSSPSTVHSVPPHLPPWQPSVQQSSAFVHAAPSALQKLVHCVTPACPCTGSQRPLQQLSFLGSQACAGAVHVPGFTQKPLSQRPLQHSAFALHVAPSASHAEATHLPSEPHAFEQQSVFPAHAAPFGLQPFTPAHEPLSQELEQQLAEPVHDAPFVPQLVKPDTDAHLPLSHRFEQQSEFWVHAPPPESHTPPPSAPTFRSDTSSEPHANARTVTREAKKIASLFLMFLRCAPPWTR